MSNINMFNVMKLKNSMLLVFASCMSQQSFAMQELPDEQLSGVAGQQLVSMTTINPGELGNPNGDVGFYRVNINARLDLNANLNKLRLGCDTPADNSVCDISIDKVSFTGIAPKVRQGYAGNASTTNIGGNKVDVTGKEGVYDPNTLSRDANGNIIGGLIDNTEDTIENVNNPEFPRFGTVQEKLVYTRGVKSGYFNPKDVGPITDFVMDGQFMELAIKNPKSLVDREIVGYRFGAKEVWGTMSTGEGPNIPGTNLPKSPDIYGPSSCDATGCSTDSVNYGSGEGALDALWKVVKQGTPNPNIFNQTPPERIARFNNLFKKYVNDSIERGHTGVNYISGRLPVRLDNINVNARVYDANGKVLIPGIGSIVFIDTESQTAIVSANLKRQNASDFGLNTSFSGGNYQQGYLRNVFLGDSDTIYSTAQYGDYIANDDQVGRAPTLKRATSAVLDGMIIGIHNTILDSAVGGDRKNRQDISTKVFHQLEFGTDVNNNLRYDKGEGSKHFAFQYQALDGLQWITTDKRIASAYDELGNPTPANGQTTIEYRGPAKGYDWLSTRAGWWLESPLATVKDAYVPLGQAVTWGVPGASDTIQLKSLDLGARPIDNCYGELTFC